MATPIAHAFAAYGVWVASGPRDRDLALRGIAVCAVFAVAPDLDFLPGLFVGKPALHHQGVSHSLGVLIGVSLIGALALPWLAPGFLRRALVLGLSYGSHLAIDLLAPDKRPPIGIPLLWPLSDRPFLSPRPLLLGVHHSPDTVTPTADWLDNIFSAHNALALGVEIAFVTPFVLLAFWYGSRRSA